MWDIETDEEVAAFLMAGDLPPQHSKSIWRRMLQLREGPLGGAEPTTGGWWVGHDCGRACYLITYTADEVRRLISITSVTRDY